jgi:hypothetical protein
VTEDFNTLYCDPGEDFGSALGNGTKLLAARTEKMWPFALEVDEAVTSGSTLALFDGFERDGVAREELDRPLGRIVCEDFRIYPWAAKDLAFDQVRTARVIGALTLLALKYHIPLILQGANIKSAAQAAGAEELYYRPLKENRHQNDAIQHFVFYTNVELMGIPLPVPDSVREEDFS